MNTPIPPNFSHEDSHAEDSCEGLRDGLFAGLTSRPSIEAERSERLWTAIAQEANLVESAPRPALRRVWTGWAVAAAIALLVGIGVVLNQAREPWVFEVAYGQPVQEVQLEGGARAVVRPGSRLEAVAATDERVTYRVVRGEAWFDVESRPSRTFEVQAEDLVVEVLGTAFSVRATPTESRVALERGSVRVIATMDTLLLAPGEGAVAMAGGLAAMHSADVPAMLTWRAGTLDVQHMPLARVLAELELHYGMALEAGTALAQTPISGRLALDVRPESTLYALSVSVGARVEPTPTGYRFVAP